MKTAMIAIATLMACATPALAADNTNFTGIRGEVTAGYNDILGGIDTNDIVYGAAVGVDIPFGDKLTLGVEGSSSNVFEKERQIGAAARVGYAFNGQFLGYVKGGYDNYRDSFSRKLDGATVGAGIEYKIGSATYLKGEYRYSDFAQGVGSSTAVAGIGIRF